MRSVTLIRSADERVVRGYDQNYNKKQKYLLQCVVLFFMYDSKSFSNIIHLDSLALAGAVGISRAKNQRRWCLQQENVFREELCTVASDYQGKRKIRKKSKLLNNT